MVWNRILGNGNILVCLDRDGCIRDFYYPYVGQENHVSGNFHRIGVFVDGNFSWINKEEWVIESSYKIRKRE
jgi:GH15 family glucan-1,4-alpha-glucosidase